MTAASPAPESADASGLLDAYSNAVTGAARVAAPAMVHLEARQDSLGGRRGTVSTSEGERFSAYPTTSIDRLQQILDSSRINKTCEIACLRRGQKLVLTASALERPE